MRRGWIFLLLAAAAGAQEFSEAELDRAIEGAIQGQRQAVECIAAWGPRAARAAPALVTAWSREEERPWQTPGLLRKLDDALWAIGPAAIPDLAKAVKGKDPSERAARLLRRFAFRTPAAPLAADREKRLIGLLNDKDTLVRLAAANGLATRGPSVVPALIGLLGDKSQWRRQAAAHGLACVEPAPEEAAAALMAALADTDAAVRDRAVIALARLRSSPQKTFPVLLKALDSPNEHVVEAALRGLQAHGKEFAPQLMEAWDQGDAVAGHAADVLASFGDSVRERVDAALTSGTPRQRRFAAVCLGVMLRRVGRGVEPALVSALGDPDADVRLAVSNALGLAPTGMSASTLDALLKASADQDPRVRAAALAAAATAAFADPRVLAAATRSATDSFPGVRITSGLITGGTPDAAAWGEAVENARLPLVVRLLATRRLRGLPAGFAPALPSLARTVRDTAQSADLRFEAAFALKILGSRRMFEARGRPPSNPWGRDAAESGLRWLAGAQQKDGRWAAEAWNQHDLGVTGLAILAFLAAGHTHLNITGSDPYADNIRAGLDFIMSTQTEGGLLISGPRKQHTLVEHAIATQALVEAVAMTYDWERRAAAATAVAFCAAARNPALAWRYEPRGGENDTHVTTWMVTTLRIADATALPGLAVDPAAFEGARVWIDKMTEPLFGQVGYNYPGGQAFRAAGMNDQDFPADLTEAPTAAGVWCRILLGEDPRKSEFVKKGADTCVGSRPTVARPGAVDFYYWYYGSLACYQVGGGHWAKWAPDLFDSARRCQEADGSWPPVDAWGFAGGRVYATAILTLALLTENRYPRGWTREEALPEPYLDAKAAVRDLWDSDSGRFRSVVLEDYGAPPK